MVDYQATRAYELSCTGLGVTSSEVYAEKQADLYEEQQARLYEEQQAALCDSGLPDTEVCDVLQLPPLEMTIYSEAWSRGCATTAVHLCIMHHQRPPDSSRHRSEHIAGDGCLDC